MILRHQLWAGFSLRAQHTRSWPSPGYLVELHEGWSIPSRHLSPESCSWGPPDPVATVREHSPCGSSKVTCLRASAKLTATNRRYGQLCESVYTAGQIRGNASAGGTLNHGAARAHRPCRDRAPINKTVGSNSASLTEVLMLGSSGGGQVVASHAALQRVARRRRASKLHRQDRSVTPPRCAVLCHAEAGRAEVQRSTQAIAFHQRLRSASGGV